MKVLLISLKHIIGNKDYKENQIITNNGYVLAQDLKEGRECMVARKHSNDILVFSIIKVINSDTIITSRGRYEFKIKAEVTI
jgi:hypothetical protein